MSTATADESTIADIEQALRLLHEPGDVFEVRALKVPRRYGKPATVSGYFDDPTKAADAWLARAMTLRARSVSRSNISWPPGTGDRELPTTGAQL